MSQSPMKGLAELFVTQINEQRHVLTEAGEHLGTLSDPESQKLTVRIRQVLADHVELYEGLMEALGD